MRSADCGPCLANRSAVAEVAQKPLLCSRESALITLSFRLIGNLEQNLFLGQLSTKHGTDSDSRCRTARELPMRRLLQSIRSVRDAVRSPVAWLFVCLHASWFLMAIANMSPPSKDLGSFFDSGGWSSATLLAGRPFHFHYESVFLKALLLADLPSLLAVAFGLAPVRAFFLPALGHFDASYVAAGEWLWAGSLQWLVIGAVLEQRFRTSRGTAHLAVRLKVFIAMVVVLALVCTALAVPQINTRSRALGFRHGGISFGPSTR